MVDINHISGRNKNVHWMNKVDDEKLFHIITNTQNFSHKFKYLHPFNKTLLLFEIELLNHYLNNEGVN